MITKKTEYAIRAMWELSQVDEGLTTANLIAQRKSIPPKYLPQIISELSRAGLVISTRRYGGGLKLSRPTEEIKLFEIIQAIQGSLTLFECLVGESDCEYICNCGLKGTYQRAQQAMENVFSDTNLSDLTFGKVSQT